MMKKVIARALVGFAIAMPILPSVGQQMPSDAALDKAMKDAQRKAATALGDADRQSKPSSVVAPRIMPKFDQQSAAGVDPALIAEQYKQLGKRNDEEAPELIVFVSLSMPQESLRRIGQQAKKLGAVVVFRGMKNGVRKGSWSDSLAALKPVADTGASVQIHPELFSRYSVTVVPTLVVAAAPQAGCQDEACAAKSASAVGDVSLDYALERFSERNDSIGKIARDRLKRLRNS